MGKTLHGHRSKRGSGHHNNRKNDVITPSASPAQPATVAIAATTPALTTDDCLAACSISTSASPGCRDGVGNRRLSLSRGNGATGVGSSKVAQVSYQFAHPLSESLRSVDLATLARGVRDWRSLAGVKPTDELEERIVDRLIQLEKLQLQTIDQERAARRMRFVAAPTPSGATTSADRGQLQPQRCIRVPSASFGGGGTTNSVNSRRNDCRPSSPSATAADSSTAENQLPNGNDVNQTCRLCNGHHSDTAQCDSSVGSNFVYVSRSLRSQIVDSLLQNSNNNNNNNNGSHSRERPPPQNASAVNGGGGTRITSSVTNRSRSPSAGPNFSPASVVTAVRTSTFNCLTVPCLQLPPATNRGDQLASAVDRRSPTTSIETQSANNYRLSTAHGSKNRVRGEQFPMSTAGISTGSGYGGIVGSLSVSSSSPALTTSGNGSSTGFNTISAGNLTRYDAMLVAAATGGGNGKHCLSAPTSTDYLPTSPAVSPSASDRDLVHDFKLLGIRLSLQQSNSGAAAGSSLDKDGSGCDFGNQPDYQQSDVASDRTAVFPAVGTTGSSFLPLSMPPHQRLRQSQSQHRRSADGCGTGGSFPLYRKASLSIHPASDFGHSSSGVTSSSLSDRSSRPSTARYLRLNCSGRAACWTAVPIGEWKSMKKRPRTAIV